MPVSKFSSEKWLDVEIGSEMTNLALHSQGRARKFFNIKRIKTCQLYQEKKKEKKVWLEAWRSVNLPEK